MAIFLMSRIMQTLSVGFLLCYLQSPKSHSCIDIRVVVTNMYINRPEIYIQS